MKLSQLEKSFIRAEQKRQSRWLWARWVNATVSLLVVAGTMLNMKQLLSLIGDSSVPAVIALLFWPFCSFVVLAFSGCFVYTLAHWQGDIATSLLIRLVQDHDQDDSGRPAKGQ
jgi:hypothetical protein